MGCHIDGFIALVGHTHVLQQGPVTGRAADVIAAANTAAEVALRLVRPGKKVFCLLCFLLYIYNNLKFIMNTRWIFHCVITKCALASSVPPLKFSNVGKC